MQVLDQVEDESVELVAIDPPYDIKWKGYDIYEDTRGRQGYLGWCREWFAMVARKLTKHGSLWLAINDEFVSELDVMAKEALGLHKRGHIIWYYGFGVACQGKFSRTHTHWLYYTRTKTQFTFNDMPIRVSSARLLKYGDKRADPKGCLPHDVWVLHPDELAKCFHPHEATWRESRVAGTFKSRIQRGKYQEQQTCPQMPDAIMDRIIVSCSNPGDLVLDCFLGNGSTGAAAIRNGRRFWGCDISKNYVDMSRARIEREATELRTA